MFQSLALVRDVARSGLADVRDFETCIGSVLRIDAESAEAVYGGAARIAPGLGMLLDQLGAGTRDRDRELTHYAVRLLDLERRLARRPDVLISIREGIENAAALENEGEAGEAVVGALAELYVQTIATLGPRIMVGGEPRHLHQPRNAERVRALLLAGVRAAVLWRQMGGGRLRLLLGRSALARAARELLDARWR